MDETRRAIEEGHPSRDRERRHGPELTDWLSAAPEPSWRPSRSSSWRCSRCATYASRPTPPKAGRALADQVALMREASDEYAKRRYIDQKNERANEQRVARRRQADSSARHGRPGEAQRGTGAASAGRARPRARRAPVSGPDDEFGLGEDLVAVPFYPTLRPGRDRSARKPSRTPGALAGAGLLVPLQQRVR